jgi:hypothetical protein
MTASSRNYPFDHPITHADWLPEHDPLLVADQAPDSYAHTIAAVPVARPYFGEVRDLAAPQLTESDLRDLSGAEQARILREASFTPQQLVDAELAGRTAADELSAIEAEQRRIADTLMPKLPDEPMGPDLETPQF